MLVFLVVSLIPIFGISSLLLQQTQSSFQNQTIKLLTLAANNADGSILIFLDRQKVRTQDWSSDSKIRMETEAIVQTGDSERVAEFSAYLKNVKLSLDKTIIISDIFDLSGHIIASSEVKRVGFTEENPANLDLEFRFSEAKKASHGQTFISKMLIDIEPAHPVTSIFHVSVPIFSISTNKAVGVMVNHISGEELNNIISSEQHTVLGTFTGGKVFSESLETYLVNKDGLMVTPSRFVADAVLKQKVFTDATRACLEDGREFSGRYKDYRGVLVYGS